MVLPPGNLRRQRVFKKRMAPVRWRRCGWAQARDRSSEVSKDQTDFMDERDQDILKNFMVIDELIVLEKYWC